MEWKFGHTPEFSKGFRGILWTKTQIKQCLPNVKSGVITGESIYALDFKKAAAPRIGRCNVVFSLILVTSIKRYCLSIIREMINKWNLWYT